MILGGFLSRIQILGVALVCAVLQEAFSNLPENEAVVRLLFSSAGFVGTGLFVSELMMLPALPSTWQENRFSPATPTTWRS